MSNLIRLTSARAKGEAGFGELLDAPSLIPEIPEIPGIPERPASSELTRVSILEKQREEAMLDQLDRRERLRLVEFVCTFAWADFEIQPEERTFISQLIRRLELDEDEDLKVQQWLDRPANMDHLDPTSIPTAHRRLFVEAIEGLIAADGEISDEERESFEVFQQLLVD